MTWWSWSLSTSKPPATPTFISVVITVRNEEAHLPGLLESLLVQQPPFEIVIVDALSEDSTWEIIQGFRQRHPNLVTAAQRRGHRGAGRNAAVGLSKAPYVAFIDGDCRADPHWLEALRRDLGPRTIVAGTTRVIGPASFAQLSRVELVRQGMDVTYPSCNLAYDRGLFRELNGFDERFITAEDIDLNLRAVMAGARIAFEPTALVEHHARPNVARFLLQAFWNGYGRKQLTEKHGQLWANYRYRRMMWTQRSPLASARLVAALAGYFTRILTTTGTTGRIPTLPDPAASSGGSSPPRTA